ncbi:MAG: ankyrin repeat domain-containing protein [Pseudomonadales bacterium]|nr:ankyrin repeat domain-containing protein [Pseudomonadales bacterium]
MKTLLLAGSLMLNLLAAGSWAQDAGRGLLELASAGETVAARELLTRRTDVNASQTDGTTALHWAVYYDDVDLVQSLLRRGANATVKNDYGASPLSQAAITGNPDIIAALLKAGADANEANADGQTPLMVLARTDNLPAAQVLLDAGADVNVVEQWRGQTALMWAAAQQQPAMVKLLLAHGADPDAQSTPNDWERQVTAEPRIKVLPVGGLTPLLYAAREGCTLCVQYLIEGGADVDKTDPEGVTPLLMATLNAHWDSAKLLLEGGANPNKWDWYGRNPLYAAVDYNTLPHGGRPDRLSADLTTSMETIELLLQAGANPNLQLKLFPPYRSLGADRGADGILSIGTTPFLRAARAADLPAMTLLLEHGALPDLPTLTGVTPLMVAAGFRASPIDTRGRFRTEEDAYETVKFILEKTDVDINATEEGGQTALHAAAFQGWNSVVTLLAQHGADLQVQDSRGNTPIDAALGRAGGLARGQGVNVHTETAALLESLSAEKR